mgnify:CR=1 FL=1
MSIENILKPKLNSTVITKIGKGIAVGRNEDWSQLLVAFHNDELDKGYLEEHPKMGNPILWIDQEDVLEDLGTEYTIPTKQKRKRK